MSGTTSLDDLPLGDMQTQPVQLQVSEQNTKVDVDALKRLEEERQKLSAPTPHMEKPMSQEQTATFVQGLQEASQRGALSLPSNAIPMDPAAVRADTEARVNFIPQTQHTDYIGNAQTRDEIIAHSNMKTRQEEAMDSLYDEMQTPILVAILFFVFMVPSVRATLFRSFPMLLKADGNPTLPGYAYIAFVFGSSYFVLNKALQHFSQV